MEGPLVLSDTPRPLEDFRSKRVSLGVDLGKLGELCCETVATELWASVGHLWIRTSGDDWLNDLAETLAPVEEHIAGGIELCEKIEINNVASQNRAPVLTGSCK